MILYEMKLDDFFQFKNFEIDFTYSRESKYSPISQAHKKFPKLKFKKFGIILGANASGKTTLGKALCIVQNFLKGKDVADFAFAKVKGMLENEINKKVYWNITFSTDVTLYNLTVEFNHDGVIYEKWKKIKLKNRSYIILKRELEKSSVFFEKNDFENKKFSSSLLSNEQFETTKNEIDRNLGYIYSFSGETQTGFASQMDLDSNVLTKIMSSFDNSIKKVYDSEEVEGNKVIEFWNGYKEIILKNGNISDEKTSVLSTGTKESIYISYLVYCLLNGYYHTLYVDEKLSHSHSEIEQQIIQIFITLIDRWDGQVFITSHNSDLLKMNIPNYNFMLLKKNLDGTISEVIQPEKIVKHQNRSLKKIVEDDIFSTAPNLDDLISLHESFLE